MAAVISPISQKEKTEILRNWISYPSPTVSKWLISNSKPMFHHQSPYSCPYHMLQNKWACVSEWQECSTCSEANFMWKVRNFYIWENSMTTLNQERTEFRAPAGLLSTPPATVSPVPKSHELTWFPRCENWVRKWRAAAFPAWALSFCSFPNRCRFLISTYHLAVVKSCDAEIGATSWRREILGPSNGVLICFGRKPMNMCLCMQGCR